METSPVYKSKNPSSYTSQSYKEWESNEEKYYTSWKGSEHTQEPKEHEKESEDISENNRKFFDALPVWWRVCPTEEWFELDEEEFFCHKNRIPYGTL